MLAKSKAAPQPKDASASQRAADDDQDKGQSDSVKVAVRVRPFTTREKDSSLVSVVTMNSKSKIVTILNPQPREMNSTTQKKTFQFDNVFWSLEKLDESGGKPAGQVDVYNTIGRPLVVHAFNGFNSCLFAYGQTGSGKTYTMMGGDPSALDGVDAGVTPRLCLELFETRARIEAEGHSKWTVEVGYIEVYNERVSDLLAKRKKGSKEEVFVDVREHPTRGVFIEGQQLREVVGLDDVVQLIEAGNRVRHTAATKMNDRSSRSHAIFMLMLREERTMETATGQTITTAGKSSRMNLVDLAGSERVLQSEVVGQQFSEARHINLSLTTLGRVIDVLADMAKNKDSQWSMPPYRESKLTYILKDSLGGNSKTFMIATVSPSALNYEETLSTLRYASRARDIVNVAKVNEDPRARRIRELEEQMERMHNEIQGKDPAYVAELEEKLELLEAEAQKRAADLQALEKEREKNEIREKMLRATEAERQELLTRAYILEQRVKESRRQAAQLSEHNEKLQREREEKERDLLEQMRQREASMENYQFVLNKALNEERDCVINLRYQSELYWLQVKEMEQRYGLAVDYMENILDLLRSFYDQRTDCLVQNCDDRFNASMGVWKQDYDNTTEQCEQLTAMLKAMEETNKGLARQSKSLTVQLAEKQSEITDLQSRLANTVYERDLHATNLESLEAAKAEVEKNLESMTAERNELADNLQATEDAKAEVEKNLESMTAERDELADNLQATEDAKAEVEKNLESMTAERDELADNLQATEDAKAEVERNLESMTAERDELADNLQATEDAKVEAVVARKGMDEANSRADVLEIRLKRLEKDKLRLKEAFVNLQMKSAENEVRLRVRHDRLASSYEQGKNVGEPFSLTKKLLARRNPAGKENFCM